jgi:hypothetical protein
LALLPAASVNVAARSSFSELRSRMARRALAASFPRRIFLRPAVTEPFAFAMTVFRLPAQSERLRQPPRDAHLDYGGTRLVAGHRDRNPAAVDDLGEVA